MHCPEARPTPNLRSCKGASVISAQSRGHVGVRGAGAGFFRGSPQSALASRKSGRLHASKGAGEVRRCHLAAHLFCICIAALQQPQPSQVMGIKRDLAVVKQRLEQQALVDGKRMAVLS